MPCRKLMVGDEQHRGTTRLPSLHSNSNGNCRMSMRHTVKYNGKCDSAGCEYPSVIHLGWSKKCLMHAKEAAAYEEKNSKLNNSSEDKQ